MTDYRSKIYESYITTGSASCDQTTLERRRPHLAMIVSRFFPKDRAARICDLGCGHGALIKVAREFGYSHIEGVDVSPEQVQAARELGELKVSCQDLLAYLRQQDPESLSMVVTLDVIEHFDKTELLALVGEIYRVLDKGGKWLSHQPNGISPYHGRIRYGDYTHQQAYTPSSMQQLALLGGFCSTASFDDPPVARGIKGVLRGSLWRLFKLGRQIEVFAETGAWESVLTQNFFSVSIK